MIKFTRINNATPSQTAKLLTGLDRVNLLWQSDQLKEKVLAFPKFTYTTDTNQQIWDKMQAAFQKGISIQLTVVVPTWRQRLKWRITGTSVLGYEENGELYMYSNFIDSADLSEIVMNLAHECQHEMDYTHPFNNTPDRDQSEPYAVGYMFRDLVK